MTAAGHRLAWVLSLALSAAGALASHGLAYRIVEPDGERRHHLLEETGHGYLNLELAGSLLAALVVVGFTGCVLAGTRRRDAPPLWIFALAPPLEFALQEHAELVLHYHAFERSPIFTPVFLVGLGLQIPFALMALIAARTSRSSRGAGEAIRPAAALPGSRPMQASSLPFPIGDPRRRLCSVREASARLQWPSRSRGSRDRSAAASNGKEEGTIRHHTTRSAQSLHRDADRSVCGRGGAFAERVRALGAHRHGTGNDVVVPESPDRVLLGVQRAGRRLARLPARLQRAGPAGGQRGRESTGGRGVAVGLEPELPPGTYTVAWRVVSADSDPPSPGRSCSRAGARCGGDRLDRRPHGHVTVGGRPVHRPGGSSTSHSSSLPSAARPFGRRASDRRMACPAAALRDPGSPGRSARPRRTGEHPPPGSRGRRAGSR